MNSVDTEDELIERLRSDPYDRMCLLMKDRFGHNSPDIESLRDFLKEHGWTVGRWARMRMRT